MKNNETKILLIQGTPVEIGQSLTNIYGQNPTFKVIEKFESQSVREVKGSNIASISGQTQYEPIMVLIIAYQCQGDIKGLEFQPQQPNIKGTLKN